MVIWLRARKEFTDNRFQLLFIYIATSIEARLWRAVDKHRSNYVYRTVKPCKSLKRDVHKQMCCRYNNSTINTNPLTAFAANHL